MVFIDIHFTLALLWHILTRGYNIWPGFITQALCTQLLVGSLIQVLLVDMSYLTYLWFQCLPSESKYPGFLSILVTSNAVLSAYTLVWGNYCYSNVLISAKQVQTLQAVRENVYIEIY